MKCVVPWNTSNWIEGDILHGDVRHVVQVVMAELLKLHLDIGKEWDACAGELIAQEAGAFVKRYREDHGICILAACPGIAQQLLEMVE